MHMPLLGHGFGSHGSTTAVSLAPAVRHVAMAAVIGSMTSGPSSRSFVAQAVLKGTSTVAQASEHVDGVPPEQSSPGALQHLHGSARCQCGTAHVSICKDLAKASPM
jgi:hypothetical protein